MNVTEGSVCIMGRTQRVFNCGEAQLYILTDVYPTITIESQQKPHTVQAVPVPIMKTQGWRILADSLLLFH